MHLSKIDFTQPWVGTVKTILYKLYLCKYKVECNLYKMKVDKWNLMQLALHFILRDDPELVIKQLKR